MLVVRSIDCFETRDAPNVRIIKDTPCDVDITSGPATYHPDDLPPFEEIPCVRFYSGRRAAEGRDPMVSICFSQEVFEKIGFLLDIAIYPNKEIEALRAAATKETARARELESDLSIAKELNNQHSATIDSQQKIIEKLEHKLAGMMSHWAEAEGKLAACENILRHAALLPFWKRLKFLLGWSLRWLLAEDCHLAEESTKECAGPPQTKKARWLCRKCNKEFERLSIAWGTCGGEKVDILDSFCPHCPSNEVEFLGSDAERDAYWDAEWDGSLDAAEEATQQEPTHDTPPETDAAAAPNRGPATD